MRYVQQSILSINTPKYLVNSFSFICSPMIFISGLYVILVWHFQKRIRLDFPIFKASLFAFSHSLIYMSKFFIVDFFYFLYYFVGCWCHQQIWKKLKFLEFLCHLLNLLNSIEPIIYFLVALHMLWAFVLKGCCLTLQLACSCSLLNMMIQINFLGSTITIGSVKRI